MRAKESQSPESVVRDIRRNTGRDYSAEGKIRMIIEGLKETVKIASTLTNLFLHRKLHLYIELNVLPKNVTSGPRYQNLGHVGLTIVHGICPEIEER